MDADTLDDLIITLRRREAELIARLDELRLSRAALGLDEDWLPAEPEPEEEPAPRKARRPRAEGEAPRAPSGRRLQVARLLLEAGPLKVDEIAGRLAIPRPSVGSAVINHPWFEKPGHRKSPYRLTDAGVEALRALDHGGGSH